MAGGSQLGPFPSTPLTHRGIAKPYLWALIDTNRQWLFGTTRSEPKQSGFRGFRDLQISNNIVTVQTFEVADLLVKQTYTSICCRTCSSM